MSIPTFAIGNQESEHSTSQKISCLSCGKQFANKKSLCNHKGNFPEIRQSDPDKVTCVYCAKKYKDKKNIQNHIQQVEYCRKLHQK